MWVELTKVGRHSPFSFKHVSLCCLFLNQSSLSLYINIYTRVQLTKELNDTSYIFDVAVLDHQLNLKTIKRDVKVCFVQQLGHVNND